MEQIIVVILLLGVVVLLSRFEQVRAWFEKHKKPLPLSAPASNMVSKVTETVVLFCGAIVILGRMIATNDNRGYLLYFDELQTGFVCLFLIVIAGVLIGIFLVCVIGLFKGTAAGVVLMPVVLFIGGLVLNEIDEGGKEKMFKNIYTISVSTPYTFSLDGADLWVNGVYLGKTPVKTTIEEFQSKVPYWSEVPEEKRDYYADTHYHSTGVYNRKRSYWDKFIVPFEEERYDEYYARVKFDGNWGHSGSGSGGGGGERGNVGSYLEVIFAGRNERFEKLLDKARLSDYRVGGPWFEAIESYGTDGWMMLREAIDDEPQLDRVLSDWAVWRYGLEKVVDSDSAWETLERICDDADRQQYYNSASVMGKALEMLVPKLDSKKLVGRAVDILFSSDRKMYGCMSWQAGGKWYFGSSNRESGFIFGWGRCRTNGYGIYKRGGRAGWKRLPSSAYAIVHAIWKLDELLDEQDDKVENIFERELVPAIIAFKGLDDHALLAGCQLGGSAIEKYLLQKDWMANPEDSHYTETISFKGESVNKWLYLLANLRSSAGRKFRRNNGHYLLDLADGLYQDQMFTRWNGELNFLFWELDVDKLSPALQFWPRFSERARRMETDPLRTQWWYLNRLGDLAGPDMYVEALRKTAVEDPGFDNALEALDGLDYQKRKAIAEAVLAEIEQQGIKQDESSDYQVWIKKYGLGMLKDRLVPGGLDESVARRIVDALVTESGDNKPEQISDWLAYEHPDHPLVKMLVESPYPHLRILVMGAIKERPTPLNRQLLDKLLKDDDEQVRAGAQKVKEQLKAIEEMSFEELMSKPKKSVAGSEWKSL
jgi:hypothetical protein